MNFDLVLERLQLAFEKPLPGAEAQALMAPQPRRKWPAGFTPDQIRTAAGLLLLFPIERQAHIVLTVRADTLGRHGGQVSLPGGVTEPGETFEHAALREAHEEIALTSANVSVLGALTPIDIPVSGFRLHPIVAAANARPSMAPADGEVAQILEVPLAELIEPACRITTFRQTDGLDIQIPMFQVGEAQIWGATAMVLAEFLVILGWNT